MKSRKWVAVEAGLGLCLVIAICFAMFTAVTTVLDTFEERNYYKALYQIEQQSTEILIDQQMRRMSTLGLGKIHIEVPCDAERGLVHQLEVEVRQ